MNAARVRDSDGKQPIWAEIRRKLLEQQVSTLELETETGHNAFGRLRIVRVSGRVHCLVAEGGSETFRLIHRFTVGSARIRLVSVQAKSSDDQGAVSAIVSDLIIKEILRD